VNDFFLLLESSARGSIMVYSSSEDISLCATAYCKRQCQSFKVHVFDPYHVLPDIIVSITPYTVMVMYYLFQNW
jgi:hypothetical protein